MANYHQNPSYLHQETAPTEQFYQNYGFSPTYDQGPPHPSSEYLRQPATAPAYPAPPLLQQPVTTTHIHVQPAQVHVEQQPPRVVYVQQEEDEPHCCLELCCVCTECVCMTILGAFLSTVLKLVYYILALFLVVVGLGVAVYFLKYYKH